LGASPLDRRRDQTGPLDERLEPSGVEGLRERCLRVEGDVHVRDHLDALFRPKLIELREGASKIPRELRELIQLEPLRTPFHEPDGELDDGRELGRFACGSVGIDVAARDVHLLSDQCAERRAQSGQGFGLAHGVGTWGSHGLGSPAGASPESRFRIARTDSIRERSIAESACGQVGVGPTGSAPEDPMSAASARFASSLSAWIAVIVRSTLLSISPASRVIVSVASRAYSASRLVSSAMAANGSLPERVASSAAFRATSVARFVTRSA